MENPVSKNVDPDQMPHNVASDLGLQFAYDPFRVFQVRMG